MCVGGNKRVEFLYTVGVISLKPDVIIMFYISSMVTTNQKPIVDTQEIKTQA